MQYQILIEHSNQNGFVASVIGLPDCVVEGATEEEAINRAKLRLKSRLTQGKIVTVDVDVPAQELTGNPWIDSAGIFKDDPTFDVFLEEIAKYRREGNAQTFDDEFLPEGAEQKTLPLAENPFLKYAGHLKDDPYFDEMM
ncbi:MAG: hypothetical protein ACRD82_15120, partial [Blastocatellia bacterium]